MIQVSEPLNGYAGSGTLRCQLDARARAGELRGRIDACDGRITGTGFPYEFEFMWSPASYGQQTLMMRFMVGTAQSRQIPHFIASATAPVLDVMQIKISGRPAAGHRAAMAVACKHLAPDARGDGRPQSLGFVGVQ